VADRGQQRRAVLFGDDRVVQHHPTRWPEPGKIGIQRVRFFAGQHHEQTIAGDGYPGGLEQAFDRGDEAEVMQGERLEEVEKRLDQEGVRRGPGDR